MRKVQVSLFSQCAVYGCINESYWLYITIVKAFISIFLIEKHRQKFYSAANAGKKSWKKVAIHFSSGIVDAVLFKEKQQYQKKIIQTFLPWVGCCRRSDAINIEVNGSKRLSTFERSERKRIETNDFWREPCAHYSKSGFQNSSQIFGKYLEIWT